MTSLYCYLWQLFNVCNYSLSRCPRNVLFCNTLLHTTSPVTADCDIEWICRRTALDLDLGAMTACWSVIKCCELIRAVKDCALCQKLSEHSFCCRGYSVSGLCWLTACAMRQESRPSYAILVSNVSKSSTKMSLQSLELRFVAAA